MGLSVTDTGNCRLGHILVAGGILDQPEWEELARSGRVRQNGQAIRQDVAVQEGDCFEIPDGSVEIVGGCGPDRLQARVIPTEGLIESPVRVHCGLHKCLTEYTKKVYRKSCEHFLSGRGSFRHFFHRDDAFYAHCQEHRLCSVSGRVLDLSRFHDIRAIRLVRDPRDLVVSSYFYHKRGAEHWCLYPNPTDTDWMIVNGKVPTGLAEGESITDYLNRVSIEEAIMAEVEFREYHFHSMLDWPDDDRVLVVRYEDFVGREALTLRQIFSFLGFRPHEQWLGGHFARKFSAARVSGKSRHIRDPSSAQWKKYFSEDMNRRFCSRWGDLLARYGYE